MKQHIIVEQLNELNEEQKEKLKKWWKPEWGDLVKVNFEKKISEEPSTIINLYDHINDGIVVNPEEIKDELPLLSIGQMIEFLDFDLKEMINEGTGWKINLDDCLLDKKENFPTNCIVLSELCDILWIAVKDKLKLEELKNK